MGFTLLNHVVNPLVRAILGSPLHGLLSRRVLLITYTGRRTGSPHTIPVGYRETPEGVTIRVGAPDAKVWWRNLREPAPVELRLRGRRCLGEGRATESDDGRVAVDVGFRPAPSA